VRGRGKEVDEDGVETHDGDVDGGGGFWPVRRGREENGRRSLAGLGWRSLVRVKLEVDGGHGL